MRNITAHLQDNVLTSQSWRRKLNRSQSKSALDTSEEEKHVSGVDLWLHYTGMLQTRTILGSFCSTERSLMLLKQWGKKKSTLAHPWLTRTKLHTGIFTGYKIRVQIDQETDKTCNLQDAICSKDYVLQITNCVKKSIFFAMAKERLHLPHFQTHMWA